MLPPGNTEKDRAVDQVADHAQKLIFFGLFAPADGTLAARSRDLGTSRLQLMNRLNGF
jgi:hypothetical protein